LLHTLFSLAQIIIAWQLARWHLTHQASGDSTWMSQCAALFMPQAMGNHMLMLPCCAMLSCAVAVAVLLPGFYAATVSPVTASLCPQVRHMTVFDPYHHYTFPALPSKQLAVCHSPASS
jgi:hypothetical protein